MRKHAVSKNSSAGACKTSPYIIAELQNRWQKKGSFQLSPFTSSFQVMGSRTKGFFSAFAFNTSFQVMGSRTYYDAKLR